jgi:hypothetical protein
MFGLCKCGSNNLKCEAFEKGHRMSFEGHRMYILERQFGSVVSELQLPEGVAVLFRSIYCGGIVIYSITIGRQTYFDELGQWSNPTSC